MLVDLFVNYDCSLQAANLYERSIKCLRRLMALEYSGPAAAPYPPAVTQASAALRSRPWPGPLAGLYVALSRQQKPRGSRAPGRRRCAGGGQCTAPGGSMRTLSPAYAGCLLPCHWHPARVWAVLGWSGTRQRPAPLPAPTPQKLKATAFKAVLAAIKSLDTWAGPIKSAAAAVALQPDAAAAAEGGGPGPDGEPAPPRDKEVGSRGRCWTWQQGPPARCAGGRRQHTPASNAHMGSACRQGFSLALQHTWAPCCGSCGTLCMAGKAVGALCSQRWLPPHLPPWCPCLPLLTQELRRILADKELKDALLSGIEAFNANAVKGEACWTSMKGRHRPRRIAGLHPGWAAVSCCCSSSWMSRVTAMGSEENESSSARAWPPPPAAHTHIHTTSPPPPPPPAPPLYPTPGLRAMVQSGTIPDATPAAAARFLRDHAARLDKAQIGELFGHHEEHSIQVWRTRCCPPALLWACSLVGH